MLVSRAIDDKCKELIKAGIPVPNFHSGTGQEALAVGVGLALKPEDYLMYTYRDFGALLAKGVSLEQIACDLLLREPGTNRGFGGIMHVVAPDRGVVGRNGVFGSRFGIAVGLGLASRYLGEGKVVLCTFGEAEGSRGPLYEALNIACLWRLPVVFVAENNGFSISTRTQEMFATGNMSDIWRGLPLPVMAADGNDVEAVYNATRSAVAYARAGLGPVYLEFVTYRIDPHVPADDDSLYRTPEEIQSWRARDPIECFERRLVRRRVITEGDRILIRQNARIAVSSAFEYALASKEPDVDSMSLYVYLGKDASRVPGCRN
jgi:pyruvate dehydrogenase E1 component alpha subunit